MQSTAGQDRTKKLAAITVAALDDQKEMRESLDSARQFNRKLASVVMERASLWARKFDGDFTSFFERQTHITMDLSRRIAEAQTRFGEAAGKMQINNRSRDLAMTIDGCEVRINQLVRELEEKNEILKTIPEDWSTENTGLKARLEGYEASEAARITEMNSLTSMNRVLMNRVTELQSGERVRELEHEVIRLREQMGTQNVSGDMRAVIAEKDAEIQRLMTHSGASERIDAMCRQLDEKDDVIESLDLQVNELTKQVDEHELTRLELEKMTAEVRLLRSQLDERPSMADVRGLSEQIEETERLVQAKDEMALGLQLQLQEVQSTLIEKMQLLTRAEGEISSILMEKGMRDEELVNIREERDRSEAQVAEMREMMASSRTENQTLTDRIDELTCRYEATRKEIVSLEARISTSAENERDELVRQISDMETENGMLVSRLAAVGLVEERAKDLEEEVRQCQTMIDTYKRLGESVQRQLDDARERNQFMRDQVKAYGPETPDKKRSISCSPMKLSTESELMDENERLRTAIAEREQAYNGLSEAAKNARVVAAERANQLKLLNAEFSGMGEKQAELRKHSENLESAIAERDEKLKSMSDQIHAEALTNFELSTKVRSVTDELVITRRTLEEVKASHAQFSSHLGSVLGCSSESGVVSAVVGLTGRGDGHSSSINTGALAASIQCFAASHMKRIEEFTAALSRKCNGLTTSLSRLRRSTDLNIRRREFSGRSSIATSFLQDDGKPPSVLKKPRALGEAQTLTDFSKAARVVFAPRDRPSNYESMAPRARYYGRP